jgi:hypothetical protein
MPVLSDPYLNEMKKRHVKGLQDALNLWCEKRVAFEKELARTSDPKKEFELGERIKSCKEEIKRLEAEIQESESHAECVSKINLDELRAIEIQLVILKSIYGAWFDCFGLNRPDSYKPPLNLQQAMERLLEYDIEYALAFAKRIAEHVEEPHRTTLEKWITRATRALGSSQDKITIHQVQLSEFLNRPKYILFVFAKCGEELYSLEVLRQERMNTWLPILVNDDGVDILKIEEKIQEILTEERDKWGSRIFIELALPNDVLHSYDVGKLVMKDDPDDESFLDVISHYPVSLRSERRLWKRRTGKRLEIWREKSEIAFSDRGCSTGEIIFQDECSTKDLTKGVCVSLGFSVDGPAKINSILATGAPVVIWFLQDPDSEHVNELKNLVCSAKLLKHLPKRLQETRSGKKKHWSCSVVLLCDDYHRVPLDGDFSSE